MVVIYIWGLLSLDLSSSLFSMLAFCSIVDFPNREDLWRCLFFSSFRRVKRFLIKGLIDLLIHLI
jgi:hypothetical protein